MGLYRSCYLFIKVAVSETSVNIPIAHKHKEEMKVGTLMGIHCPITASYTYALSAFFFHGCDMTYIIVPGGGYLNKNLHQQHYTWCLWWPHLYREPGRLPGVSSASPMELVICTIPKKPCDLVTWFPCEGRDARVAWIPDPMSVEITDCFLQRSPWWLICRFWADFWTGLSFGAYWGKITGH